jgi:hypothetical protein
MRGRLNKLGVYIQPDGSIAVSEYLPTHHVQDMYLVKFESFKECLDYLNKNLDEVKDNFISLWKSFEDDCENCLQLEEVESKIKDDIVLASIEAMMDVVKDYESLVECYQRLLVLAKNIKHVKDDFRRKITYYATLIDHSEAEMIEEHMRVEDIEIMFKLYAKAGSDGKLTKEAYWYGQNQGGGGPSGLNSPLHNKGPYSGFDHDYDRVMDGDEIGEGRGHATEKFEDANRFKRKPHLMMKKNFKYRSRPLKYVSKKMKKKLRREEKKKEKKGDYRLKSNGLVYTDVETDPTYIYWWDIQRNNPTSWEERGGYPSWSNYQ